MAAMEQLQRAANSTATMAVAVLVALVLTILAVGYRPPDPVFQVSKTMAEVFRSVHNATFQTVDTVVVTGEDVAASPIAAPAQILGPNLTDPAVSNPALCDPGSRMINCSDPGALAAIEMANRQKFPDMGMFEYTRVVRGSSDSKCDIGWKFATRNEKSSRTYRDYREYTLLVNSSCDYVVEKIGAWHSGKNARWRQADMFNDTAAAFNRTGNTFWSGTKYLYYSRGGDQCKSMSQYLWSLLCALGEARYLNRTLVMELEVCLSAAENPGHERDEADKDFRFYYDYEHLQRGAAVVELKQFQKRWLNWNKKHPHHPVSHRAVDDVTVTPMQLREEQSSIVWRRFSPDKYWYRVCEGEAEKVVQRPWEVVWKSKRLMNVVNAICGEMEWDFDAVHVVRGSKAQNREKWPNLERDTMPEEILRKLDGVVEGGRRLYVATNEMLDGYFDKLREKYRLYLLSDFSSLWAPNSQWYNDTKSLLLSSRGRAKAPEFDGYMRAEIDSEIFLRAKKRVETFGQLTSDCKHGLNTC